MSKWTKRETRMYTTLILFHFFIIFLLILLSINFNAYQAPVKECLKNLDNSSSIPIEEQLCDCLDENFEDTSYKSKLLFGAEFDCKDRLNYRNEKYLCSMYPNNSLINCSKI